MNSAINRFYYAAFYGAKAMLATKKLDSSKHSGVISLFQQHFVKTGVIPSDMAKALPRSFEQRIDTDYEDFLSITVEEIERTKTEVERFLEECKKVLSALIASSLQ
ncbi:MAG: HEPN domain-containing protein [Candidatus Omnitrophica bacterium]|nr:HEPN domain-containing protein [Candidatus Omnitrophota bacterium]MBU1523499.1 HEPN domain-containing protein [Candidatus Omnitrophota bacterium]